MINKFLRAGSKVVASNKHLSKTLTTVSLPKPGAMVPFAQTKALIPHSNTHMLKALQATTNPTTAAIVPVKAKYVSPYSIPAPAKFMILCNRSPYAMQTAEEALKDASESLYFIT